MKLYIITWSHKYGIDTWPHFGENAPDEDDIISSLRDEGSWDDDAGELGDGYIDVTGPFDIPEAERDAATSA